MPDCCSTRSNSGFIPFLAMTVFQWARSRKTNGTSSSGAALVKFDMFEPARIDTSTEMPWFMNLA